MDGTASLCFYLGYLNSQANANEKVLGGIVRGNPSKKKLALIFTGHEFADGAEAIRNTFEKK